MRENALALFERNTMPITETGCFVWLGSVKSKETKHCYGKAWDERIRKNVAAHRFSWELFKGPIPNGIHVLHKCDVPSCVNPDHLFLGTHSDNMKDMVSKGHKKGGKLWDKYCRRGHLRTVENTDIYKNPQGKIIRSCRICDSVRLKQNDN